MSQSSHTSHALRVNVGFILKETIGYYREILYEAPRLEFDDDFSVTNLTGAVTFTRTHDGILGLGQIRATATLECARCLAPAVLALKARIEDLFYFPPDKAPEDAEWVIGEDANLDLAPLTREDFLITIPIQVLCRPDCRGLCPTCGKDLNTGPCDCPQETLDPRLSVLARLRHQPDQPD